MALQFWCWGTEILGLMKSLAKRTEVSLCAVKPHPLGLPAQPAEVTV